MIFVHTLNKQKNIPCNNEIFLKNFNVCFQQNKFERIPNYKQVKKNVAKCVVESN